jgi:hypothetical protein
MNSSEVASDESSRCFPETIDLPGFVLENVRCSKQLQHIARGPTRWLENL